VPLAAIDGIGGRHDVNQRATQVAIYLALHVGADVQEIEAIYDRLVELGVIEVVRERTEVEMTAQGRSVAGESMGEQ
jgi:helix-turn-helix protein